MPVPPQETSLRRAGTAGNPAAGASGDDCSPSLENIPELFRLLVDNIHSVFYVRSLDEARLLYVSPAYASVWGRSCESLYEHPQGFLDAIHPEDRERVVAAMERHRAGEILPQEYRVIQPGGAIRWVMDRAFPVRDESGRLFRVVGIAEDITDRKRAEEMTGLLAQAGMTLAASLDYATTLDNLAKLVVPVLADWCAIDVLDSDGQLKRVSVVHRDPAKVELAYEVQRRYPFDPDAPNGVAKVLRTAEAEMVPVITKEMINAAARDEEYKRILLELNLHSYICVPLATRGGVLGALTLIYAESDRTYGPAELAIAEDLARRSAVAVDNALLYGSERAARTEAERAGRIKDEFLATLSHELRTPLNAICGWSALLRLHDPQDEEMREGLEVIERNAKIQAQLIDDLLDMSRIVAGKLKLDWTDVPLSSVVHDAIDAVSPAADARQIHIDLSVPKQGIIVRGDAARLQQVVWNLLSNAVKFTSPQRRIRVVLDEVNGQARLEVADSGIGISPQFLPHVFERFRQADGSISRQHAGLGLGLAIVKQLVEIHGGEVQASSSGTGQGATFTVTLPLLKPE